MNKKINILIVGGTGFIGFYLARKCLELGWSVTSISARKPRKIRKLPRVKYLISDISKKNFFKVLKTDFDYVVNLGGYVDHSNKKKTYKTHYQGSVHLANFFLNKKIKRFVQVGSGGEYGKAKSPQKEIKNSKPLSVYSKSKYLAAKYLLKIYKTKKFPITIFRLYQVYGPRQDLNRFIPIVIHNCIKNKTFPCSNGKQYRDFIYVTDVISAILRCFKKDKSNGKVINLGSGKPLKIKNIIFLIKKITKGGKPQLGKINFRKEENLITYPNILRAKKLLKWKPKINFRQGLIKTIRFYEKNFQ